MDEQPFDHTVTGRGRAFLWGGVLLGVLLIVLLFTRGFGLLAPPLAPPERPLLLHQGDRIVVPEGSALRAQLSVAPAVSAQRGARIEVPATVEADPARSAPILAPLAGRVRALRVQLGDRVNAGQELVVIDSPDLSQALDDDRRAAAALGLAGRNLERQQGQARIGAASERDLDQARSDHAQAQAEYTRTQARLRAVGADPKRRSALLSIRAPFAGSITTLTIAPGAMVNDTTQPLMTVVNLGSAWVTALVAEKDVAAVAAGQDAQVVLAADPTHPLAGKVLFVSDIIEPDSHRNKVRIAFSNESHRLKPNMFATVTLVAAAQPQVTVPTAALLMNNDRTSVFVATAPWTFERRAVEADLQQGDRVVIRAGLAAGEQVVVRGGILLND